MTCWPDLVGLHMRLMRRVRFTTSGCREFTGSTNSGSKTSKGGYGKLNARDSRNGEQATIGTHIIAWMLNNGSIPDGLFVLHRCDNRRCVNVEHLFLGTQADNIADMVQKGRAATGDRNSSRLRPWRLPRGSVHKNAKLSEAAVADIRRRLAAGEVQQRIADLHGISQATVTNIKRGLVWRHVSAGAGV